MEGLFMSSVSFNMFSVYSLGLQNSTGNSKKICTMVLLILYVTFAYSVLKLLTCFQRQTMCY